MLLMWEKCGFPDCIVVVVFFPKSMSHQTLGKCLSANHWEGEADTVAYFYLCKIPNRDISKKEDKECYGAKCVVLPQASYLDLDSHFGKPCKLPSRDRRREKESLVATSSATGKLYLTKKTSKLFFTFANSTSRSQ